MSVTKNYLYNVLYQIISLIIPIITVPYISRILGAEGIGINAYTNSIVQYFIVFGTIGISLYATRITAFNRDNKEKLSIEFWSLFLLKLITITISFSFYLIFIFFHKSTYKYIYIIQSLNIFASAIDISWLFFGLEDFKKTVTRSLVVKIISIILIFAFIRYRNDLSKYILINALSLIAGQLLLWQSAFKFIGKVKINYKDIKKHLLPALKYFLPQIAIQVYAVLDKTMIGIFTVKSEVGIYENADKIMRMSLALVTSVGAVMLPKITNIYAKKDIKLVKEYLKKSFDFECYLAIPIMFGIMGISKEFAPWFFGKEFIKTGQVLFCISPVIIAIAWSNVFAGQFLIPIGRINEYTISVTTGAIVNFSLNSLLIPKYASIGASIATVIAEFTVTGTELYFIRKDIKIGYFIKDIWKYFIAAMLMFISLRFIGILNGVNFVTTILQITTGTIIYFIVLFILKSNMNIFIFDKIKNQIRKLYNAA